MVAAAVAGGAQHAPAGPPTAGGSMVPYFYGTNQYVEKFAIDVTTPGANAVEKVFNVNPGGFMRGVRLEVRSTGGTLGTGVVAADGPWTLFSSISLENIDGSPIIYPMQGFSHYVRQWFSRPWWGDPSRRYDFSNTINPAFSMFMQPEIRQTAGVLANTDARALYRIRFTYAPFSSFLGTVGSATAPTVTTTCYLESWAQPDATDLRGTPIEQLPPGLQLATLTRHQIINLASASNANVFQASNTGNEIRVWLMLLRDGNGVRQDALSDPIRWRLDNRSLGVMGPNEVFNRMNDFYESLQNGTSTRPTGVYVFPRFFDPGRMVGEAWMATTNASYIIWESTTAAGITGVGTLELITDEVVPLAALPMELESI